MRRQRLTSFVLALLGALAAPTLLSASGGPYALSFPTIAGGGGSSFGGTFMLSATISEASTSALGGGEFSFTGGFWSVTLAPVLPSPPLLNVALGSNSTVVVSWPASSTDWFLQQSFDLKATSWTNVSLAVTDNGTSKLVILNSSSGNLYLRLKQ